MIYINRSTTSSLIFIVAIKTVNVHVYLRWTFGCLHFVMFLTSEFKHKSEYSVERNEERTNTIRTKRKIETMRNH